MQGLAGGPSETDGCCRGRRQLVARRVEDTRVVARWYAPVCGRWVISCAPSQVSRSAVVLVEQTVQVGVWSWLNGG